MRGPMAKIRVARNPTVTACRVVPPKPNTVHLMILMHFENSIRTLQQAPRGRSGKLLIFLLTPRGRRWPRLETTRSSRISSSIASWNAFLSRGGNSSVAGQLATDDSDGVKERKPVGIFSGLQGGLVHQTPDGKMRQQEAVKFLPHQVRRLAAQHDLGPAQVSLQFIEGRLHF